MLTDVLERILRGEVRELRPREFLFRQGEPVRYVYAVQHGHIKLVRHLHSGRLAIMHIAREGETFAEAALFSDIYHCSALTEENAAVRLYKKAELLKALDRDPSLMLEYIARLSRQVQALRTQLELHNIQSARERILQFLLLEAPSDSFTVDVSTSLKTIAAYLGLAHETFYRELTKLENDGVIGREGKTIKLLKVDPL